MSFGNDKEQGKGSIGLIAGVAAVGILAGVGFFVMNTGQETQTTEADISSVEEVAPEAEQEAVYAEVGQEPTEPVVTRQQASPAPAEESEDEVAELAEQNEQEREANAMEIQYLKEVLPDNIMIPVEKTPQEVESLFAQMEEQHALEKKIADKQASQAERERYFELRAQQYEDEIEIINLCTETLASSDPAVSRQGLCANAVENGQERLKEIEGILGELRGQYLTSE